MINPFSIKALGRMLYVLLATILAAGMARGDEKKDAQPVTAGLNLKLSGYAQILGVDWDRDVDSFSVRRARLGLSGEIIKNLKFNIRVDLVKSPTLLDASVEYEPSKLIGLRIGQFLVPFSLESTTATSDIDLVNRSSTVDTLAAGRDNGSSGRDIGAALYGSVWIADYTLGFFNGAGINKSDTNNHKDFSGRVVIRPLGFFSLGGSIYRGQQSAPPTVPLVRRNKEGLEAAILISTLSFKSEYIHAADDLVSKAGWYVQAGWFALPKKVQALVRYDSLDLDRAVSGDAKNIITLGASWFIFGKTKLQVNYEIHRLEADGREKSGLLAQFQAAF